VQAVNEMGVGRGEEVRRKGCPYIRQLANGRPMTELFSTLSEDRSRLVEQSAILQQQSLTEHVRAAAENFSFRIVVKKAQALFLS